MEAKSLTQETLYLREFHPSSRRLPQLPSLLLLRELYHPQLRNLLLHALLDGFKMEETVTYSIHLSTLVVQEVLGCNVMLIVLHHIQVQ